MKVDINELKLELPPSSKGMRIKVQTKLDAKRAVSVRETDKGYVVSVNPKRIRSDSEWQAHKEWILKRLEG